MATGLVAVGDAWACTNPSLGRGASIGAAARLRAAGRAAPRRARPTRTRWCCRFDEETAATVAPYRTRPLSFDRHRLAEIDADVAGVPYQPDDPAWAMTRALCAGGRWATRCWPGRYAAIAAVQRHTRASCSATPR